MEVSGKFIAMNGAPMFSPEQLKQIGKKLAKDSENKSKEQIDREIANTMGSNVVRKP